MEVVNKIFMNSNTFRAVLKPFAQIWANTSGYRRLGLRYDDLIIEESSEGQEALRRLPEDVMAGRIYRMKRAYQLSGTQAELPQNEWTKPEEDKAYYYPVLQQVKKESKERETFDSLKLVK
ncbi:hypothetical protein BB558_003559 [Smittium angustum]|uniref:Cytochrome b-c1 complex subunit 7 n=1 Tax=Smittium angustum TaxID=133377 RepID=A0A2U1J5T0_SMIAN|nr:hypothetical protein BB558_003559 [Smittium angustum]